MNTKIFSRIPIWIPPAVVFFVLICLYGFTASTRLTWANYGNDGGDFLAAILTGGIPHPTGYPAYMILGMLFQRIPFGDVYFRVVLLSFLPAALAAGFFVLWVNSFCNGFKLPGMISGLVWGMSPLLWSQSVIIEVYGLQSLFTVLALWWVTLLFRPHKSHPLLLVLLALVFGAGLGNHLTIIFFLPACFAGLVYWGKQTGRINLVLIQVGAILLGGFVYLYLPIQARSFPPINWGNPQTIAGFVWEVTGNPYQSLVGSIAVSNVIDRIFAFAAILRQQVGIIGLVLGIIGAYQFHLVNLRMRWVCLWVFLSYLVFSIGYNTADSTAYLIPVILIFSGWIGFFIFSFKDLSWKRVSIMPILLLVVMASLIIRTPGTINQINPQKGYTAAEFAEKALSQFPENAIVTTSSDLDSFPLWAYHFGYGLRKDVSIIVLPLTQFEWYQQTLTHTYPALKFPAISKDILNTTIWGDQIGSMNLDHVVCKSENKNKTEFVFTCSNGKIIDIKP